MKLEQIEKLIREKIPQESIWRSNIVGDNDYFKVKVVPRENGKVTKGYVHITTSIGFRRYGEWSKFDFKIYNGATREQVLEDITYVVEYYNKCKGVSSGYAKGFADYVKSTGGHKGNPVWMD